LEIRKERKKEAPRGRKNCRWSERERNKEKKDDAVIN
jgi:hypothetical protein